MKKTKQKKTIEHKAKDLIHKFDEKKFIKFLKLESRKLKKFIEKENSSFLNQSTICTLTWILSNYNLIEEYDFNEFEKKYMKGIKEKKVCLHKTLKRKKTCSTNSHY